MAVPAMSNSSTTVTASAAPRRRWRRTDRLTGSGRRGKAAGDSAPPEWPGPMPDSPFTGAMTVVKSSNEAAPELSTRMSLA